MVELGLGKAKIPTLWINAAEVKRNCFNLFHQVIAWCVFWAQNESSQTKNTQMKSIINIITSLRTCKGSTLPNNEKSTTQMILSVFNRNFGYLTFVNTLIYFQVVGAGKGPKFPLGCPKQSVKLKVIRNRLAPQMLSYTFHTKFGKRHTQHL